METAFAFDLDGTLTQTELLPLIAREIDLEDEISLLTEATIKGIIPFEKSFRLRCRLLDEIPVSVVQEIVAKTPLNPYILEFIYKYPAQSFIVSGNLDIWLQILLENIGCTYFVSNAKSENNRFIKITNILNKANAINEIRKKYKKIVVVGEGMNDVPMFEKADIGIAYGGVHPPNSTVIQLSNYVVLNGKSLCRLLNTLL